MKYLEITKHYMNSPDCLWMLNIKGGFAVDEDVSLFEEYGYVVERHGEILEDFRK